MNVHNDAINHVLGCAETLIDLVNDGASSGDLRRYIVVALAAAVEEVKRTEPAHELTANRS